MSETAFKIIGDKKRGDTNEDDGNENSGDDDVQEKADSLPGSVYNIGKLEDPIHGDDEDVGDHNDVNVDYRRSTDHFERGTRHMSSNSHYVVAVSDSDSNQGKPLLNWQPSSITQ